ncbi:MAG TPA: VanZ family protein [Glaciibacter sp.]|nr:VanZ family protein [Glaciibacter sp.]
MTAVRRLRRVTVGATLAYFVVLVAIAFWPVRVDQNAGDLLYRLFTWLYRHDAPRWLDYDFLEFSANVILFIPVGLFVVILAGARRWWLGILAGFVTSCAIEAGQLMFLPSRFATVEDIVANTSGAALGTLFAAAALAIAHARERRARAKARFEGRARLSPWA